ncbi:hypothetical protein FDP41_000702 [Naegleria fowleri]|uniref:Aminotransferase class I/classII domain-containing protein n=1 Tax=Naegleria fowleri TaxID=5763 RepID=A0A6A5C324_NAEFO|nr:uncharacterized protein FDP41_000702 [Naegleria fowleri]KAF0984803.1 hypothetical protein FDP41_000702 [Naegleria fowleri]CAG4717227.1 unnamed protein product [Naegleria fowleri]
MIISKSCNSSASNVIHKDEEYLVLGESSDGFFYYNRSNSPQHMALQDLLMKQHEPHAKCCQLTASGIQAISATLHGIIISRKNEHLNLIYSDELYCDSPRLFQWIAKMYKNVTLHSIDILDKNNIICSFEGKFAKQTNILFFESCSNPNGKMFDFSILQKLEAASKALITIVDNTWLTHEIFNPFTIKQVDYVVSSLTKYYSAGHCIGGMVLARSKNAMKGCTEWMVVNGNHVSPYHCELVKEYAETISDRIAFCSDLTKRVITEFLVKHPKVLQVNHPLCQNHPSHALMKIYFKRPPRTRDHLVPSVFTFKVKGTKSEVLQVLKKATILEHKTSFGAKMSRTDPWPQEESGFTFVRLSVGYEDNYERIVRGLEEILSHL